MQSVKCVRTILAGFAVLSGIACAQQVEGERTSASAPPQVPASDAVPHEEYQAWKADLAARGIKFSLGYRSEDLAAISGVEDHGVVHAGQVALTSAFDMARLVDWQGARITASASYRDGQNINDRSGVAALLGPQEIYGRGHYVRLTQLWLDQSLLDNQLQLRLGRLAPGEDFQATECSFINLSFCANQPGNYVSDYWFNWPISQWGIAAQVNLGAVHYVKVGVYQVNQKNLSGDLIKALSPHGGMGVLMPFEWGWTPTFSNGRMGEYKIGGWYSSANRLDVYEDTTGGQASTSALPLRWQDSSRGAFLSVTQQLTHGGGQTANSGWRMVFKASAADRATSLVDHTVAMTFVHTGPFANRPFDDLGFALAFNHLNDRIAAYRSERLAQGLESLPPGSAERTLEAYYSLRFGSVFMFRPDVQWIRDPGGIGSRHDVVIVGMRSEITF